MTTEESDLPPVTSVPSLVEPSISDSTTPAPQRRLGGRERCAARLSSPRPSRDCGEPGFDETSSARDDRTRHLRRRPSRCGSGPAVQGPTTLLSPSSNLGKRFRCMRNAPPASNTSRVRRASLSERLRPFLDDSSANELIYPNKADRPWRYIVLHHSAAASGNYDQIDARAPQDPGLSTAAATTS